MEDAFLERLDTACRESGLYQQLQSDFLIFGL